MRTISTRLALLSLCCALGSTYAAEESKPAPQPQPLVKIDDFTVNSLHFALFAGQTGRQPETPDEQLHLLNELVSNFMVANSAQGKAIAADPEVAAALEVARARLLAQAVVSAEIDKTPIDEAELHKRFDEQYANAPAPKEYKARHILVSTEDEAKQVIAKLEGGADFATLAKEMSTGPSGSSGGDLGWFEADQMVPEFSAATVELADGDYTKTPVKTQFGYHVILREGSRDLPKPTFEGMKDEIEHQIQQERVGDLIASIREKTDVELLQQEAPAEQPAAEAPQK